MESITSLIRQVATDEPGARDKLYAAAYGELRKLARSRLRDGGRNLYLDTTALVHESYLKSLGSGRIRAEDRRAFFAYASRVMRSVIVDAVRERQAEKRGGDRVVVTLTTRAIDGLPACEDEVMNVHEALDALERVEPRLAQVVEMRYFGGYTDAEVAEAMNLNQRTVRRDWDKARLLLRALLES